MATKNKSANCFSSIAKSALTLTSFLAISMSISSPAIAALTHHDEIDEAVTALTVDVDKWTLEADKNKCSEGEKILKSASEFIAESELDAYQSHEARESSAKLEVVLKDTCHLSAVTSGKSADLPAGDSVAVPSVKK